MNWIKSLLIVVVTIAHFSLWGQCQTVNEYWTQKTTPNGNYITVFFDDFNSSNLNTKAWGIGFPWGPILKPGQAEGMAASHISISNSILDIKTDNTGQYFQYPVYIGGVFSHYDLIWKNFTSSGLFSRYQFIHGQFEIQYKIEEITGQWPAFWLLGDCKQEIDIMEIFDNQQGNAEYKSIKYTTHLNDDCNGGESCMVGVSREKSGDFHESWINSKLNWVPWKLEFFYNHVLDYEMYRHFDSGGRPHENPPTGFWYRTPSFPYDHYKMNLYVGQGVADARMNEVVEKHMLVDYIAVRKKIDCESTVTLCNSNKNDVWYDGFITGGTIYLGTETCSTTVSGGVPNVSSGEYLHVFASEKIEIVNGFEAKLGSDFSAQAIPCPDENQYSKKSASIQAITVDEAHNVQITNIRVYDLSGKLLLNLVSSTFPLTKQEVTGYLSSRTELPRKTLLYYVTHNRDNSTFHGKLFLN